MSGDEVSYEKVLADLEARKARLDIAIAAIKEMLGQQVETGSTGSGNLSGGSVAMSSGEGVPIDAFFGMSLPTAIQKCLSMKRRPQTVGQIETALESGGFIHRSKKFASTVHTTLRRGAKAGEIVKVSRGLWALPEWYRGAKPKKVEEGSGE